MWGKNLAPFLARYAGALKPRGRFPLVLFPKSRGILDGFLGESRGYIVILSCRSLVRVQRGTLLGPE